MMGWTYPRFAVIPTNGRDCVRDALAAIQNQVDALIIIKTPGPEIPVDADTSKSIILPSILEDGMNIAAWWNEGLSTAQGFYKDMERWDVAVINDDVIVGPDWFDRVSEAMRRTGVSVASMGDVPMPGLITRPGPIPLWARPQGFAWMTAGEKGLRADEEMKWWYSDDDLWQQAIAAGGALVIPGQVKHLYPNGQMTPELQVQAGLDRAVYVTKHGFAPW